MVLGEAKRLYRFGFALHWLRPKSKAPLKKGWSTGPRATWEDLEKEYQDGFNVGVRLGTPSTVTTSNGSKGYLCVIDCDVKSNDPKHLKEAWEKKEELFGAIKAPIVLSGRGMGSHHAYGLSAKPIKPKRVAQSCDRVEVETSKGLVIRPAWEISLMGDRQQVVLPPSIHPDTGNPYLWETTIADADELPWFDNFETIEAEKAGQSYPPFTPVVVDLVSSSLSDHIVELILTGKGSKEGNRSNDALPIASAMLKAGFNDNEILSILVDQDTYIGSCSWDRRGSLEGAADWARKYCLEPAKNNTCAERVFEKEVVVTQALDEVTAQVQASELTEVTDWRQRLDRTKEGLVKSTLKNVTLILSHAVALNLFEKDEFANSEVYGQKAPWKSELGKELRDIDIIRIKSWFADNWHFEPGSDKIHETISKIADDNSFHPVRDYLNDLIHDGVPRIDNFLETYFEAKGPTKYLRAISRKILCAMVARVFEPGCKFDYVPILIGKQGERKSTALRALAGDTWFSEADFDIRDKDAVLAMQSKWLFELGELSSLKDADTDQLKAFVTRVSDRIRAPYGRRSEDFPRQCVFIGTTNRDEIFKDDTGNRRFWPIETGYCDVEGIQRDRNQLFAEAKLAYDKGEKLYLNKETEELAKEEQESRMIHDIWQEMILEFFRKEEIKSEGERFNNQEFTMRQLFESNALGNAIGHQGDQKRAGKALRKLGYAPKPRCRVEGIRKRLWVRVPLSHHGN